LSTFGRIKSSLLGLATNLRGWRTRRKLLVIESDDWGAIRTSGPESWDRLLAGGIPVDRSRYDVLDCLEGAADLDALFNVLSEHRDGHGHPALFTFNTVMGNPDFDAISRDRFESYHHQHFFDSYRYYHGESLEQKWAAAMTESLIRPQFHGKEHLNVPLWMRDLHSGHQDTIRAFEERYYALRTRTSSPRQFNYLAAYSSESEEELESAQNRLAEGMQMFQKTFGYVSKTFIACNYVLPAQAEPYIKSLGVELLQGQRGQFVPSGRDATGTIRRTYMGKRNISGLLCSVRNVIFEPFESESHDWVRSALRQIQQAFFLGKPAVVCSHRVNYVAGMQRAHRDRSLSLLDSLLAEVRRRWPEVEFVSSDQLADEMIAG